MQPHMHHQSTPLSMPAHDPALRQQIPWWNDLDAATINELTLAPPDLPLRQAPDVVVVGAGVAGLSAALSARAGGAGVLVLEREPQLGCGATGRNAGILSAGINMSISDVPASGPEIAFWPETTGVLLSLVDEAARPGSLLSARLTGAISLAESRHAARKQEREARRRIALGLRAELWSPAQVAEATAGRLNVASVVNALWLPDEGRIHPLSLLAYLAQQARAAGITIMGQAPVASWQEETRAGGYRWRLALANGASIMARGLINATGPMAQPNARIYALAFAADLPATFPLFWDASPYTYADFRPGNGRLGVSGGRYGRAGVTRHDGRFYRRLADAARRWLPELAQQEPLATWAVDLQVAADMVPCLRPLGKVAPGLAIEGLGALGVLPGIILGRRAGSMIAARL